MTRYLITGAQGMLGTDLCSALSSRKVTALARTDLDITDESAVLDAVAGHDVVINAAAYTKVDDAEQDEHAAYLVNARGARNLARAAAAHQAKIIHVSTDYVFDGKARSPYSESATRAATSAYGRSKAQGEIMALAEHPKGCFIVRTAWLYGKNGSNFAKTMLTLAKEKESWNVVTDQFGQPTWSMDLAKQIVSLCDSRAPAGIYHGTNSGVASWFDFAREVLSLASLDKERIIGCSSKIFVRPAARPDYSVLGHDAWKSAGLTPMRNWKEALADAFSHKVLDRE